MAGTRAIARMSWIAHTAEAQPVVGAIGWLPASVASVPCGSRKPAPRSWIHSLEEFVPPLEGLNTLVASHAMAREIASSDEDEPEGATSSLAVQAGAT